MATTATTKSVLIAEDDKWLRELLSFFLVDEGLTPIEARTGPETVQVAEQRLPDVILLDIGLPGRSGLHVLEDLRERSSTRDIPVMLLSGKINLETTGHAHDADASFHKPLDFGAFLTKVREITS